MIGLSYLQRSGQFVMPGDRLGVIEEFMLGKGTYINDGVIYSQITGHAHIDKENKKITVFQKTKIPVVPRKGHLVVGEVAQVKGKVAHIKLLEIGRFKLKKAFSAILHVSYASKYFTKSIQDALKPGDIISAEVIGDENPPYQLTTGKSELGVLQAYCSNCGAPLTASGRQLACKRCGNMERRKTSVNYGKEF